MNPNMKRFPTHLLRFLQHAAIGLLGLGVFLALTLGGRGQTVHALPEYAARTGEPCAACHINPGGGGPRTLRGLLWAARGRPDVLPELPGFRLVPGVKDGQELYEAACAGCHGLQAEGLSGMKLAGTQISEPAIRSYILEGIPELGMPGFQKQFEAAQLDALVGYVGKVASGEIQPPPPEIPLPAATFTCDLAKGSGRCGGN
jgi:mono/diheme cytochrome c family protein